MTDTDSFFYYINFISSGCVENPITYVDEESNNQVPHEQIVSLIELSQYCEQSFKYDCTLGKYFCRKVFLIMYILNSAPLEAEGVDYAFWVDRHGLNNTYFTGNVLSFPFPRDF